MKSFLIKLTRFLKHPELAGIQLFFLLLLALNIFCGCSATSATAAQKPKPIRPSGFLEDYSLLQPSGELPGLRTFIDPGTNLTTYHMVMLEPVEVKTTSTTAALLPNATKPLGNRFKMGVQQALRSSYPTVTQPGYGVLKLRVALTNVSVDPEKLSADSPYSGYDLDSSYVEGEFRDSVTGQLVAAFVAPQFGIPNESTFSRLSQEVRTATQLSQWAMVVRDRLYEARGLPPSTVFQAQ